MTFRDLCEKDINQVCELENEAFTSPWHRESFEDVINNKDAMFIVATDDEDVVCGYAGVLSVLGEGDICNIVVKKDCRGLGIGEQLVLELIRRGNSEYNIEAFTLEVRVGNKAAKHLYEKIGFEYAGIRPGFYDAPKEDAAIYWYYL